jgi:hypothetical protein
MKTGKSFRGAQARTAAPVFLAVLALAFQAVNSGAQITLAPGDNSSVQVDPVAGGVANWLINGNNILNSSLGGSQWFYYSSSVNPGAAPTGVQNGIGVLSSPSVSINGDVASLNTMYGNGSNPFSLQAVYTLTGGQPGSANSDLTEIINVKNNQSSALTFHFFQYANFTVPNGNVSLQTTLFRGTPLYTLAQVAGGAVSLSEYVDGELNPGANEGTITPSLVALTSTVGYGLPGPAVTTSGSGDAWLLEWDVTIPVNGTFQLSKDIYATVLASTPEPASVSLLSIGLLGFGAFGFYRRRFAK